MTNQASNQFSKEAWDANAEHWDSRMGDDGNDFFNVLCWPVLASFLNVSSSATSTPPLNARPDSRLLDIACGNGLTSRRLAALGCRVTAFDFSAKLIEKAKMRTSSLQSQFSNSPIFYHVLDATDESQLLNTLQPLAPFDSALSNMALFDMPEIEPLFRALRRLLAPGGVFVFSLMHPAFNNPSAALMAEEWDDGELHTRYAVKTSRYMTSFQSKGLALRNQPKPQLYFHRPIRYYLNVGFQNGFILDGFEERSFSPEHPQVSVLGWGGKFSEIPPVLIARLRLTTP
jgi:SAM-dependent methyltransferase